METIKNIKSKKNYLKYIADAIDFEFFLISSNEQEAREIALKIVKQLGFRDPDIVFLERKSSGSRIRVRAYVNIIRDNYSWFGGKNE